MTETRNLYFDRIAKGYADKYEFEPQFAERRQVWNAVIAPYLEKLAPEQSCIFDVGCGNGNLSLPFAMSGYKVIGLDASENMLHAAREIAEKANASSRTIYQCATLPLSREILNQFSCTADMILCSSVLEYVSDIEGALAGLATLLRPGGVLLFSVPNRRSFFRFLERILKKTPIANNTYLAYQHHQLGREQCKSLVKGSGLEWKASSLYALPFHRWLSPMARDFRPAILATLLLVIAQKPLSHS